MRLVKTWDSRKTALALYTIEQNGIIDEFKERFKLEQNASWDLVKKLCMPVWIKDSYKLRLVIEWVAKVSFRLITEYLKNNPPQSQGGKVPDPVSKAEATSLWYILLNKKESLINMYSKEGEAGQRVVKMLS